MDNLKVQVFAKLQFEGIHAWPECPISEVSFLREPHRHIFYIEVFKRVDHLNRDTEFIVLKRQVQTYIKNLYPDGQMGSTSCEMLARKLVDTFKLDKAIVSEDDENGAVVEYLENT